MSIEFIDELPTSKGGTSRGKYWEFAAALRANPGRWAKHEYQSDSTTVRSSHIASINSGRLAAFRDGGYEAAQRNGVIYVRYNPTTEGA